MQNLILNDSFTKELPADVNTTNVTRQVEKACFSYVTPRIPSNPSLIHSNIEVAELLGLTNKDIDAKEFVSTFSGASLIENSKPYAMSYAGHQFGNWAGQLGDGRAINLGEVVNHFKRWALQLKGAGATPYSRNADGLAVLRSSIREHLCSEAMFYLGVPTTRSLSLMLSGDAVLRDVLYDGNPAYEKGAIVCRVAPSFIRFGNFELFASRGDQQTLKQLADYTMTHFYPEIERGTKKGYLDFFKAVAKNTKHMILNWQRVGFVHGVMNTDNMSILGLTIDYGPYGLMDDYDLGWTPNTTDNQYKRYRFGNQINISLWNLMQLANALYSLINDKEALESVLHQYHEDAEIDYINMMKKKLGLELPDNNDANLITDLENTLQLTEMDMTIFFRNLSAVKKEPATIDDKFVVNALQAATYNIQDLNGQILASWKTWFNKYIQRLSLEVITNDKRKSNMNAVNPKYVLRNYMAQLAIDAAEKEDYTLINELSQGLKKPYDEQPEFEKWFSKRPDWAKNKIGSSMLSCSS